MLDDIVDATRRAGQFCLQMLSYAGKGSLSQEKVQLNALIEEVQSLVKASIGYRTIVSYEATDSSIFIEADANQIVQVFMNLVTNAADAIGEKVGKITVASECAHYTGETLAYIDPKVEFVTGEYVKVSVIDDGPGMDATTIDKIFDPFFTTKYTGHGLGLSAVKGIVQKHGGAIEVASVPGKGTRFSVYLPVVTAPAVETTTSEVRKPQVQGGRVILADAEQKVRAILSRILLRAGFEVLEATTAEELEKLIKEQGASLDCAIVDMNMASRGTIHSAQSLTHTAGDLPFVLLCSGNEREERDMLTESSLISALQKPVASDTLLETLARSIVIGRKNEESDVDSQAVTL